MMSNDSLGNLLNSLVNSARSALFSQGELSQLTYGAYNITASTINGSEEQDVAITYPVGWRADKQPIQSKRTYRKEELLSRYQFLALHQLPINGLIQLVTIMEALLSDTVRAVLLRYPKKLGSKRTISVQTILESSTIEEVHLHATDALLNELSYKSPTEFAETMRNLLSVNLLDCQAFHRYVEVKASRDIFIHNRGVANETYVRKAGSHARVSSGVRLPADIEYFLESYEACLQLTEWLEKELHERWHSSEFEERERSRR